MYRAIFTLSFAALLGGPVPALAQACRDDLIKADQSIHRSRADLQKTAAATPAAKCAAFRQHVAALNVVKTVFARCDTSANKAANAAQANTAIASFTRQMRQSCAARK